MAGRVKPITETADLVQYLSAPVEGSFNDWPTNIRDAIWKQLEVINRGRAMNLQGEYTITGSRCDVDVDNGVWYVHCIAQAVTYPPGSPMQGRLQILKPVGTA